MYIKQRNHKPTLEEVAPTILEIARLKREIKRRHKEIMLGRRIAEEKHVEHFKPLAEPLVNLVKTFQQMPVQQPQLPPSRASKKRPRYLKPRIKMRSRYVKGRQRQSKPELLSSEHRPFSAASTHHTYPTPPTTPFVKDATYTRRGLTGASKAKHKLQLSSIDEESPTFESYGTGEVSSPMAGTSRVGRQLWKAGKQAFEGDEGEEYNMSRGYDDSSDEELSGDGQDDDKNVEQLLNESHGTTVQNILDQTDLAGKQVSDYIRGSLSKDNDDFDDTFGPRVRDNAYYLGNKYLTFGENGDEIVLTDPVDQEEKTFTATLGLCELIFKKNPNRALVESADRQAYGEILNWTSVHRQNNDPRGEIVNYNKAKYKNTIKRLLDDSRDGGQRHSGRQVTGRGSIAPRRDFSKEKSQKIYRGRGVLSAIKGAAGTIVNKAIDILPVELHIPGYQYCGPGTKLQKRLAQGDPGINKLDQACKEHDIAYSKSGDTASRAVADSILAERAWDRVRSDDAGVLEKAAALAVTNIMKAKAKFGGGMKRILKEVSRVVEKGKKQKIQPSKKKSMKGGRGLYLRHQKPKVGTGLYLRQQRSKVSQGLYLRKQRTATP
ncbi:uncharacterized protein LOC120352087 [Nilaparvata lugens]|uniref:uncharacterized protein LOC120352087 n=1 Tax=Nilaparvata lugens TaxID=108931 RepID=UPI00193EB2FD|nr:uncharacterized protein LOC120352087 [Nilaparvata lugens]